MSRSGHTPSYAKVKTPPGGGADRLTGKVFPENPALTLKVFRLTPVTCGAP